MLEYNHALISLILLVAVICLRSCVDCAMTDGDYGSVCLAAR
jgi:hypothetical protein